MSLHDELLARLQAVASVRLLASLRDPRLEVGGDDALRVFIPDIHLVSQQVRNRYAYGTNDTVLLAHTLDAVRALKVASPGRAIVLYQMGDFFDLWRETPTDSNRLDAASRIHQDHPQLMNAFFHPDLGARFLLGNHDVELARRTNFVGWERRYFVRGRDAAAPTGILLHGDLFDWVESFAPDALQRWAVFYISPRKRANRYEFEAAIRITHLQNALHDYSTRIGGDAAVGAGADPASSIPDRHNVTNDHPFLDDARSLCERINARDNARLRFVVIGHTHHARISVHESGSQFFALIDTGAWIEACRLPDGTILPNMQVTALSANEVRIYQLGPKPA